MALSTEEIKTLAITSAIAAAGSAVATAIVSFLLERYVFDEQAADGAAAAAEPTFVVVPVVESKDVPEVPSPPVPTAGLGGALGAGPVPVCYSQRFHDCLPKSEHKDDPACAYLADYYELSKEHRNEQIDKMPYCDYSQSEMVRNVLLAAGAGLAGGMLLATAMR